MTTDVFDYPPEERANDKAVGALSHAQGFRPPRHRTGADWFVRKKSEDEKDGRFRLESTDWEEWDYDGPLRIRTSGLSGVKRAYDRHLGEKRFTDVLTPVRGYLRKSVGRRWDDVFSELTAALGRGTYPIRHVLTAHTLSDVSTDTYYENGKVYAQPKKWDFADYFVDPRDRTLQEAVPAPRFRYAPPPPLDRRYWKCGVWFVRIEGVWYLGAYTKNSLLASIEPRQKPAAGGDWRAEERDRLWPNVVCDGAVWYFVKWRQAGRKELKRARVVPQ